MGSFNVACAISNLSMGYGTKCVFIPLIRHQYNGLKKSVSQLISNEGPCHFFYPFCLPIVGYYDDYGGIKDIEKSKTTEAIEKYFGITIDEFMRIATSCRDDSYGGLYEVFGTNIEEMRKHWDLEFSLAITFLERILISLSLSKLDIVLRDTLYIAPSCLVLNPERY